MRRRLALVYAQAAALGWLATRLPRATGQGLVEYGLLLIMIMIVCIGILTLAGVTLSDVWYGSALGRMP